LFALLPLFSYSSSRIILHRYRPFFFILLRPQPISTLFPYTTLFRSFSKRSKLFLPCKIHLRKKACLIQSRSRIFPKILPYYFPRSEEHTSELQSRFDLVCRLLLEKKNK